MQLFYFRTNVCIKCYFCPCTFYIIFNYFTTFRNKLPLFWSHCSNDFGQNASAEVENNHMLVFVQILIVYAKLRWLSCLSVHGILHRVQSINADKDVPSCQVALVIMLSTTFHHGYCQSCLYTAFHHACYQPRLVSILSVQSSITPTINHA